MINQFIKSKHSKKIAVFFVVFLSFSLFTCYNALLKTPETILVSMYTNEHDSYTANIQPVYDTMQVLKLEGYSKPVIFKIYEKGIWSTYLKFYKYAQTDGSVLDSKRFVLKFKIRRPVMKLFEPRISQVLEFERMD